MEDLSKLSMESIRKNWCKYDNIPYHIFELIFNNWYELNKNNTYFLDINNKNDLIYINAIKNLIFNNNNYIEFEERNNYIRKKIHNYCSKLGLNHKSKNIKKFISDKNKNITIRVICITKPDNWSWNFNLSKEQKKTRFIT